MNSNFARFNVVSVAVVVVICFAIKEDVLPERNVSKVSFFRYGDEFSALITELMCAYHLCYAAA